ncbi:hypothetical protein [Hyperthermus butylicus]|uniref:hypothetical protein n=1 Tax=Hyperthermus butylicus TaxID=54248 RepID=UPI00064FCC14|nr:hypothetical protein [Hyperthermus butylicus]
MSIYWERCSICGRHRPTRQCWLHPERIICPYCCLACPERSICPRPAWFPTLRHVQPAAKPQPKLEEARRALEELLRKLEGG